MYDSFSFVRTNLRLMKYHEKYGCTIGEDGGGTGLAGFVFAFLRCIYQGRGLRSAATDNPENLDYRVTRYDHRILPYNYTVIP